MARHADRRERRPASIRPALSAGELAACIDAIEQEYGVDPRSLGPSELCRVLNSTPLGEVLNEHQLRRHRNRAGLRIANGKKLDLVRYVAWLAGERHTRLAKAPGLSGYDAIRDRAGERNRAISLAGRHIGELPEVVDPDRRAQAERDFRFFCETYFPGTFTLAWSDDHLVVIEKIEQAVLMGGLFAMAMPRGSGKSTLCEIACLWSELYGHREFAVAIGPTSDHATGMLGSIKSELENNNLLLDDFPEVCFPIRALEGITQRAKGQLYRGQLTMIGWKDDEIILPTIGGSKASGAIIRVSGITGSIRGMKFKRPDGSTVRPLLVLVDDPQTDESAHSPSQTAKRQRVLAGAVLGLAGPGKKIAGLMTLTVVCEHDLAERMLDRERHPEWQGERTKMVYAFPTDEKLWERYAKIREQGLVSGAGLKPATEFYAEHRAEMDAGAKVAWEARFNYDELSAIQNAMNLRLQDEAAFWSEYQNEPMSERVDVDDQLLSADQIAAKTNGHRRALVPIGASILTSFVDVQKHCLFWMVCGWEEDFTGYIVDYGTEPDQRSPYFTLREVKRTLLGASDRAGLEGSIFAGLERVSDHLLGREWERDDGTLGRIDRGLIDANWGDSTEIVYQFSRQSRFAGSLTPSHGRYVGASSRPMSEYQRKRGDRVGLNWRVPVGSGRRAVRHVTFDANFWKSFVHHRLAVPMGDAGCLSLHGRKPATHRMLADHLTAEYRIRTQGRGREVHEWKLRADGLDNHWLDCLVGCAVAASMEGATLFGTTQPTPKRKRIKMSELQGTKR